jgi:transposase
MGGRTWARRRRPHRMRATYHRRHGVEYFLGFYDVHRDCLAGHFVKRKRVIELTIAFRRLRRCYPHHRLYVILDNLPHVHEHPALQRLCRRLRIHLVYTPTNASWLNAIEAHFGHTKRGALTDTDDPDHRAQRRRIVRYIRYRNRKARSHRHPLTQLLTSRNIKLDRH